MAGRVRPTTSADLLPPASGRQGSGTVARVGADAGLSRRSLLRGAVVVTAASMTACTQQAAPPPEVRTVTSGATPAPPDDDDVSIVVAAIGDEERLQGYCAAVIRRHPSSGDAVRPLQARQRAHVAGLRAILSDDDPAPTTRRTRAPADAQRALASLVARVTQARDARFDDCLTATSGLLASRLASMAASHAASADLLGVGQAGR